ncbi:MAG: PAS domain S-box protein [Spirochaetales bacterium]|nr:PAS domain S-box protein [Spirochaetales bacterium]
MLTSASNLLTSGFSPKTDELVLIRIKLINIINILTAFFSMIFFFYNFLNNRIIFSVVDFLTAFIMICNIVLLRVHKKPTVSAFITCIIFFILSVYLLFIGGAEQFGYLWSFFLPIAVIFLIGLKGGIVVIIVFYVTAAVTIMLPVIPFRLVEYSSAVKINFLLVLGLISIVAIYYEYSREKPYKKLMLHEHWFRAVIENSASVYAVIDIEGKVLYESPSLVHVYGYKPEELIGKNIIDLVHPEDIPSALEELKNLIKNPGKVKRLEIRYRHKDGTWRDIDVVGINLLEDEAVKGIVLTSHDISERKEAEREVSILNETLETRILQRTEELRVSEEKLQHSEKMRAIGELAGGIAHDFNNQLAGIIGCADLLKSNLAMDTELYVCAETIVNVAKNAGKLTAQLLAFARKGSYHRIPVNFHNLINEVIVLLERSIDKRIVIKKQLSASSSVVVGDRDQFESMLLNIALNARDAIQETGIITFSTEIVDYETAHPGEVKPEDSTGTCLKITISDNGSGMDKETQKHIFEPFFTTKSRGKGIGMGLAAVYGTVQSHNGAIEIESSPGHGTSFSLYFPLEDYINEETHMKKPQLTMKRGNARILFIDDDEFVVRMVELVLKKLGYSITCFQNSSEGIEWFRNAYHQTDIIFLDMVMPGQPTAEVFEELMSIHPEAIIILTSGYSINKAVEILLEKGARGFLKKPFEIAELTGIIADSLAGGDN